jgi:hypothetical protein
MEDFEKRAIEQATHKPTCWYRYVDDTFVIWLHGQDKLQEFLHHINGLHKKIQFNTQTPGKYPEDNLSLQQHGESLKTRITLHVSDGLSVHYQTFKTVHTTSGICHTG